MAYPTEWAFELRGVSWGPGDANVLSQMQWHLEKGGRFSIVGPSGGGKSVLLRLLAGLLSPKEGAVFYKGKDIAQMDWHEQRQFRQSIGVTFQNGGLIDSLSSEDNLRMPIRERKRCSLKEATSLAQKALEEVGLGGQGGLPMSALSGGMQKRLGVARALLFSPEAVLFDEPAAGLDPITARSIYDLIHEMAQRHQMTIVLVTSEPQQACRVCDRAGFLSEGRFQEVGTWGELRRSTIPEVAAFFEAVP